MLNYTNYEDLRGQLLDMKEDIYENGVESDNYFDFKKGTDTLISMAATNLLTNTNDELKFFGNFTMKGNRTASYIVKRPIHHQLTNTSFTFVYNPLMIIDFPLDELAALMAKESIHLIARHYLLQVELVDKHPWPLVKLACDMEACQIMKECGLKVPDYLYSRDRINKMFNENIQAAEARDLAETLHKLMETNEELAEFVKDQMDDEKFMEEGLDPLLIGDMLKYVVIETCSESRGKHPGGLAGYIDAITAPPVIKWEDEMARFIGSISAGKKKTIMRRDRRQPNRMDLRGNLSDKEVDLVVAIDTSGSMSDDIIAKCMNEIFEITKHMKAEITIVECDSDINNVYSVRNKGDVRTEVGGRGGTYFSPVFKWMEENNKRKSALIYMTDGYGESQLNASCLNNHQGTLWVLTERKEDLSLKDENLPKRSRVISFTNK